MVWMRNGTPSTLVGTADAITISDLTARTFNQSLCHVIEDSTTIEAEIRLDNNSNTDYANRGSGNGGSDSTFTSQTFAYVHSATPASQFFWVTSIMSIDGEEKLMISWFVDAVATGASQAPGRAESVNKVDTTTNSGQFTRIDAINNGSGDYAANSNLSALGTD